MTRLKRRVRGGCFVLALLPALLASTVFAENTQRAKQLFKQAEKLYAKGQYQPALQLYLEAYRNKPLVGFQFNIGQCYRKLDRCDLANHHFRQYAYESRSAKNRATAQALIAECERDLEQKRKRIAAEVQAAADASDASEERAAGAPGAPVTRDQTQQGQASTDAADRSDTKRLSPIWFWTGVGLTATFAVVTAVTGILTVKYGSDYEDPDKTEDELRDIKDTGEALKTAANVNFGLTLASAAATTALFFLTDFDKGGDKTTVSAMPLLDGGMLAVQGRF